MPTAQAQAVRRRPAQRHLLPRFRTLPPPAYQTYSLTPKEEVTALAIDTQALYYVSSQAADRISRISLDGITSDLIVDLKAAHRN